MKKLYKIFIVSLITIFSILTVNAVSAPTNLKLIEAGNDFVKIGWDKAE